jgi:hypothetical protein
MIKEYKEGDIFKDPLQSLIDNQDKDKREPKLKPVRGTGPSRSNPGQEVPLPELAQARAASRPKALKETKADELSEARLSEDDWYKLLAAYGKTGAISGLQTRTGFSPQKIKHLLHVGIKRLCLPAIETFARKANINTKLMSTDQENQAIAKAPQTVAAVQKRATKEAATAMNTLNQVIQAGGIIHQFIEGMTEGLKSGHCQMHVPKYITMEALAEMGDVLNKHTQSIDRAVKLVRLTQGEPTERIEHQVGALLAGCTLEELQEAERTGHIPRSLVSRLQGDGGAIDAEYSLVKDGGGTIWPEPKELQEDND